VSAETAFCERRKRASFLASGLKRERAIEIENTMNIKK
jgi:hypothetical protein